MIERPCRAGINKYVGEPDLGRSGPPLGHTVGRRAKPGGGLAAAKAVQSFATTQTGASGYA